MTLGNEVMDQENRKNKTGECVGWGKGLLLPALLPGRYKGCGYGCVRKGKEKYGVRGGFFGFFFGAKGMSGAEEPSTLSLYM